MPQLRKDPVTERWIIISPERDNPSSLPLFEKEEYSSKGFCPFCYGNEDKTPAEILAYRRQGCGPNQQGWKVRVVPNRFPALQPEIRIDKKAKGVYDWMSGTGIHEIIIEHSEHKASYGTFTTEDVEYILWSYKDRYIDLRKDNRRKYILIFRNSGKAAGASIEHPHSQLIATPVVPKRVSEELTGALKYYKFKNRCVFCDIIRQELQFKSRIIAENDEFLAFCPYASRFPYEMTILPKSHSSNFSTISEKEIKSCAEVLLQSMQKLLKNLDFPAYNFVIHTAPVDNENLKHYHWHIEVVPRVIRLSGFEFGSGFYTNPTSPEEAARLLRADEVSEESRRDKTSEDKTSEDKISEDKRSENKDA